MVYGFDSATNSGISSGDFGGIGGIVFVVRFFHQAKKPAPMSNAAMKQPTPILTPSPIVREADLSCSALVVAAGNVSDSDDVAGVAEVMKPEEIVDVGVSEAEVSVEN